MINVFLLASSTPSLREKKIWQNEQILWSHIYTTNVEIRKLWHDISRFFVQFLGKKMSTLKTQKMQGLFTFSAPRNQNWKTLIFCFVVFYSTSGWTSDRLVGVIKQSSVLIKSTTNNVHPSGYLLD